MSKLTRAFQLIFGDGGDQSHFGQFGSRAAGTPLPTKDPTVIQALGAFVNNGWLDAINSANKAPFLEDMNGLFYLIFRQIAYIFQEGVPEWDGSTTYFIGSIVKKTGTFEQYGSIVNNNTGNALPNQTTDANWQFLNPPSVAPGIMSEFGGLVAPFGYLLCDGSSYPTASYPALFAAIGYNFGGGGANFNVPESRGRVGVGAGTGPGLTARTVGQIFGEEAHTLIVAEIPPNLTVNDPGHQHDLINSGSGGAVAIQVSGPNQGISGGGPGGASFKLLNTSSHTTGITVGGGGSAHNNMQPSYVATKVIKF